MRHLLLSSKTLVLTLVLMLFAALSAERSFGQVAASSTWALTASGNAANSGVVSGTALQKGSSLSGSTFTTTGVSTTGWTTSGAPSTTRYYEFDVTPTTGNNLTVTSISLASSVSASTGSVQVQYSVGTTLSGFGTGILVGTAFTTTTTEGSNAFNSLSIAVNSGQTLYVRVYAYSVASATTTAFKTHNFVVSGTTLGVSPTLTAATGATVDNSFNVTFTDNSAWRAAITSIQWGTATLVSGTDYTLSAGVLKIIPGNAIKTSGTQSLTITATNYANDVVSQTISAGAITTLNYSPAISSPQTTGAAFGVTITGKDQYGNNASGNLTMSASAGTISPATVTLTNGTVTSNETLTVQGNITITATAASNATVSQAITVNFASSSTNYFMSQASGNWTAAATWVSSYDGINFYPATIAPPTGTTTTTKGITIQSGNTIAFNASGNVDSIYIQSGGELDVNSNITMTINNGSGITNDVDVAGTFKNLGTIAVNGTLAFENGGLYNHAVDAGSIPSATWNTGSNCLITGSKATLPVNMAQNFYNLTWNSTGITSAITWGNSLPTTINGDLTFISTGTGSIRVSNSGATLNILGDLDIQGGTFNFDNGGTVATTLNVTGDVNLTGGIFQPNGAPASTRAHIINVKGNWTNNGGSYIAGSETVNFNNTTATVQTIGGTTSTTFNNLSISNTNAGGSVAVATNTNASAVTLSVNNSKLSVGSGITLGISGALTLNSNDANLSGTMSGGGSINAASLNIGVTETPGFTGTFVHTLIFNGPSLTLTGSVSINSYRGSASSRLDNGTLNFQSGTISALNLVTINSTSGNNTSTFDMTSGTGSGTFNLNGTFNLATTGTLTVNTIKLNGVAATVNYTGTSAQNIYSGSSYTNLGVSGGSIKSLTGATTAASLNFSSDNATSGKIDASANVLTLSAANVSNASSSGYVITGNGSGAGNLKVNGIGTSAFTFPIGTLADYLPASVTPQTSLTSWSASVFNPATANGVYGTTQFGATALAGIVNAIWTITPSTPSTTATLTLNWTSDLEGSGFQGYSNTGIGISHYNGAAWDPGTATGGADHASRVVTSQFSSFSPFGIGAAGSSLPVTLINFKAALSNNEVSLTWQTTQEQNSNYFDVERSSDGSSWNSIGSVEAQGNAAFTSNYSYLDLSPANGVNYYRLAMVDKDGSRRYSNVEVISMNATAVFRIFPNPAKDYVNVSLGHVSDNSVIRLYNLSGQVVFTQKLNNASGNIVSVPVYNLVQGTYMVQVSGSDGTQQTGKVIISRQ